MRKGIGIALFALLAAGIWSQDLTALYNERKLTIATTNENPASKE